MKSLAPLCNLLVTIVVSVWTVLIWDPALLALMLAAELILLAQAGQLQKLSKALFSLMLVAAFFSVIQLPFDVAVPIAVASGLKMMVMTVAVLLMLGTTRLPSLTAALVSQVKIPYEYAFMFTSALRFMPDFIAESHAVREAQICRGYVQSRNPLKRIVAYAALVEPMVLRAITRSDTMAMSLELRGFGSSRRTFTQQIAFRARDYLMRAFLGVVTVLVILHR